MADVNIPCVETLQAAKSTSIGGLLPGRSIDYKQFQFQFRGLVVVADSLGSVHVIIL